MFRTKQDVDRHAANVLGRIKNEKEKNSRGYQIARLYFDVGEYEIAKRYLSSFLSVRETVPQAHKLMGHIYLKTNDKEKSLECYKRSLELDGSQKDLIIKICELCTQVPMDPERARFWLEKAEATCPGNDVIFRLREMMAQSSGDEDFQELESLLTSEMTQRPEDVALRVKLLRLYLKSGKLTQAYNVALQTDRTMAFTDSLEWYETLMDICYAYKSENDCRGDTVFYTQFLNTLRSVVYLRLCYREPVACADILHQFDQMLMEGVQIPVQQDEWMSFLAEMSGQFFFFCGTLLLKRAQKGNLSWRDVIPLASVCYLLNNSVVNVDSRAEWFVAAGKEKRRMYDHLLMVSNFRKSQGGHTLHALGKGDTSTWTQKLRQQYCTNHGREKLYDTLFTQPDMRAKKDRSYLMHTTTFTESVLQFPGRAQLRTFDTGCYRLHPQRLSELIWLSLQRYSCQDKAQPYYGLDVFDTLQYSVKNMASGGAESLCQLDTDVFLCAAVRCAALRQQEMIHLGHTDPAQPDFLPVCLTQPLCTQEQADWWMAAYKFFTNSVRDNFSKMRHLLQRGIETVRLLGSHGMSANLVVHIARSLEAKVKEMKIIGPDFTLKAEATEARTVYYWEQALEMLERLQKNKIQPLPKQRLFKDDTDIELDDTGIKNLMSEANYSIGFAAMMEEKYEQAIRIFEKLNNPYASFNTAKIYKVLAEQERSRDAPVGREQHQILLTRARDAIFLTMDQLQGDKKHELNKSIEQHLDDIESQLQCATDLEEDEEEEPSQYHTPTASRIDGDSTLNRSTPKEKAKSPAAAAHVSFSMSDSSRHVRPSPERLDAQIRSLAYSQESLVKMVLARNEELVKINSQLVEALRENREVITQLKTQLNFSQKYNFSGLSTPGPHMASPYQPAYAPAQGMAPAQFGYQMPSPASMAGYRPQSPRPRSRTNLMGHTGFIGKSEDSVIEGEEEENPYFIDGEYFDESLAQAHGQYFVPDSHLVQDWPYGHRAGIEGNSTVTYAPQNRPQMPQTGFFASSLRGQALQYGGQTNIASSMPGPGYFSSPHGMTVSSAINQAPSLVAAIIGKDSPQNTGALAGQGPTQMPSPAGQVMQQYHAQAVSQPQPATSLAAQMGQKPIFAPGNFSASTPVAKTNMSVPTQPQPLVLGQATQTTPQNLTNRSTASTMSPSASTSEVVCIFQAKATYTSKIGSTQEGNVKVFYFGAEKGGRVRMETLTSNQIILNHDINTLKLITTFTPQLVTWKRPQPDGKGEDPVNLKFDDVEMAAKLKSVIQKIQDAGKKGTDSSPKLTPATPSFTSAQGSPAFKPTTPGVQAGSTPTVFGQSASSVSSTVTPNSAQQGQQQDKTPVCVPKSSLGGFTFNTTPMVKSPEEKPKTSPTVKLKESTLKVTSPPATEAAVAQAKPFSGFTFKPTKPITQPTPTSSSPVVIKKGSGDGPSSTSTPAFVLGQSSNSPMPSFSNLANTSQSTSFTTGGATGFKNAGKTVFSPGRGDDEDRVEEYEPNVDFKPVIELPDLVEVKTGEEDEDKVFGERARLFRFDAETSQWKERGIGEMKILYNKDTKRYRILMRREQVLKICANHNISKDMKLTPMTSSDRAWCWSAMDFAEEEMKIEKLAIKFKTPELAAKFKESFEDCQQKMDSQPPLEAIGSSEVAEKQGQSKGETKSLAEMFKPKTGSWSCPGCYCQNDSGKTRCPACNTIKPGAEEEVKKTETAKSPAGIPGSGFTIGPGGFKIGGGVAGASGGGGFSFGKKTEGGFSFGSPSPGGGFSFSSKPAQPTPTASKDASSTQKALVKETAIDKPKDTSKSLAEQFKPKEGSWECTGCYCRNDASQLKCPACQTLKPGTKPEDIKSEAASAFVGSGGFKMTGSLFKVGEGSGSTVSPKPATPAPSAKEEQKPESKSSGSTGSLLAEMLQAKDTPEKTVASASSGFSFAPKSGFSFGTPADPSKKEGSGGFAFGTPTGPPKKEGASGFNFFQPGTDSTKNEAAGFQFNLGKVSTPVKIQEGEKKEGSSPFQFTFSLTPSKSPQSKTSVMSPKSPDNGDYYVNKDDDDSHIYFEPIVSLPEKVDTKTGEEEEITHFEQRAKLFRLHENEWKERGLGMMKILEHKVSHRRRLLMRREQIFKVCCNHNITQDLELRPMTKSDGKSWVWFAQDFAEEEPKMEHLAIKFKTKEIAEMFKKEFDAAKTGESTQTAPSISAGATGGAVQRQDEVEPLVTSTTSQASGKKGNPYYKDELDKLEIEHTLQSVSSTTTDDKGSPHYKKKMDNVKVGDKMSASHAQNTGDKGNPYYKSDLDKLSAEPLVTSSSAQETGDEGNPLYSAQLDQLVVSEPMLSSTVSEGTGDEGNPLYSAQLDQSVVSEPIMSSTVSEGTGDKGNPLYSAQLDQSVVSEPIMSSTVSEGIGDKGNPLYSAQLDQSVVSEPMLSSTVSEGIGDKGNPLYSAQLDQSVVTEPMLSSTLNEGTGDNGNPCYSSELDALAYEALITSESCEGTGDKGNPYFTAHVDQTGVETQMTRTLTQGTSDKSNVNYTSKPDQSCIEPNLSSTSVQGTGDKGNVYYTSNLNQASVETQMTGTFTQSTGDKGNPFYKSKLDEADVEPKLYSTVVQGTGDKGNLYHTSKLDQISVETQMTSTFTQGTGDRGNLHHSSYLDSLHTEESVTLSSVIQTTGDDGNPYYSSELDKLVEEPRMSSFLVQGTGDRGNPYHSSQLDAEDLSGVEFLYKEEATEEQKARARKYLLPENFYLYETKPPCPGCIGCEDYDPSNPITPSKHKTKAKSETSSPVVSGAHASSIDTSGASGEFSLFKQSTGPSFSTLAAQGDASGYAFKKDESRPFHWSGAGRPLFGSSPGGQKDEGDGDEVVQSDDIDFKPVIDLPDLVEVKTGEEDWEVVYSQRSKLYRYVKDVSQWKERAVGEMKILKQNDKYRLLMRRDQVHKVACNHLLSPSLKLEPMATSETAWCWIAQDYAENEPKIEHFALRFKTEELAKQFKQKFEECQEHLRQTVSDSDSNNSACPSVPQQEEAVTEEAEEEEVEGEDSDEEIITLFEKRATLSHFEDNEWKKLGMGNLKILYNEDLNGNNIEMAADDGKKICNHVICREHTIMLEKKQRACMWSPIDFSTDEPVRRHFKASFSSVAAAEEFVKTFTEGVRLARDSELSEKLSHEMDTPVVFSRGDAPSLQVGRKYILQLFNLFVYIALAVTSPNTVSGLELNDPSDLNSNLPQIPAQPPGQSPSFVNQSEASSSGSSHCEMRTQPGEGEGSQSAASSQKGEVLFANAGSPVGSCSPELTALLDSVLEEDPKR